MFLFYPTPQSLLTWRQYKVVFGQRETLSQTSSKLGDFAQQPPHLLRRFCYIS